LFSWTLAIAEMRPYRFFLHCSPANRACNHTLWYVLLIVVVFAIRDLDGRILNSIPTLAATSGGSRTCLPAIVCLIKIRLFHRSLFGCPAHFGLSLLSRQRKRSRPRVLELADDFADRVVGYQAIGLARALAGRALSVIRNAPSYAQGAERV
jgi:hypothetical protein